MQNAEKMHTRLGKPNSVAHVTPQVSWTDLELHRSSSSSPKQEGKAQHMNQLQLFNPLHLEMQQERSPSNTSMKGEGAVKA